MLRNIPWSVRRCLLIRQLLKLSLLSLEPRYSCRLTRCRLLWKFRNCARLVMTVNELVSLFISEKSLQHQLECRSDHGKRAENLNYKLVSAIDKERRAQSTVDPPREHLLSVRFNLDKYPQRLTFYTERATEDVTESFSAFLCKTSICCCLISFEMELLVPKVKCLRYHWHNMSSRTA